MSVQRDYWAECVEAALADMGVPVSLDQIQYVAEAIMGAYENYGTAFGHDAIPNPLSAELEKTRRDLKRESEKRICRECNGSGVEVMQGPVHSSISECYKCRGSGFIYL